MRKDAVEGKTVGIRRSYVLLGSDADFLCDLGEGFFLIYFICPLPDIPIYLDCIDRHLQAFSAWCG